MARTHIVKRGDTLRKIAKARLGDAGLYLRLGEFNGLRDPNRLAPVFAEIECRGLRDQLRTYGGCRGY